MSLNPALAVTLPVSKARADKLSVVHVPRRFVADEWGGTETTILESCRQLQEMGHESRIFTSKALCPDPRENMSGIEVRRFSYSYPFWGLSAEARRDMDKKGGNLLSLSLFSALIREKGIDVLHAHTGKRMGGIVRTVARMKRIPYIISLHGGVVDVPAEEQNEMLKPLEGAFEWGRAAGALLGARRVLEDAAAIVCVGRNEQAAVARQYPGKRVVCLPNGVDANRFAKGNGESFRSAYGIPHDARVLLNVSRIDYQKNQLALLEAFARLRRQHSDLHLVLIGPVTVESYGRKLNDFISDNRLEACVTLIPGLPGGSEELRDAYHAADIFCLSSRHEPFGIVILEAWAAGLPVVASEVGGIPGFTRDGHDVLHADPDVPASFAAAINSLIIRPEQAARLSANGQWRAVNEFDWSMVTRRLESLYREVVEAHA